jgi:hypothetical protein
MRDISNVNTHFEFILRDLFNVQGIIQIFGGGRINGKDTLVAEISSTFATFISRGLFYAINDFATETFGCNVAIDEDGLALGGKSVFLSNVTSKCTKRCVEIGRPVLDLCFL